MQQNAPRLQAPRTLLHPQVWDEAGTSLLYAWRLPRSRADPKTSTHADFVRGAAFCLAADGSVCLCVGSSGGVVYCFHVTEVGGLQPTPGTSAMVQGMGRHRVALHALYATHSPAHRHAACLAAMG